jgi:hypothetical protein
MTPERIAVTAHQFARIEAAWAICSFGNGRRAAGAWGRSFRECAAEVLGRELPDAFSLAIAA